MVNRVKTISDISRDIAQVFMDPLMQFYIAGALVLIALALVVLATKKQG